MLAFSEECKRKHLLKHLRSVTLAVPISQATTTEWLANVNQLLSDSPLEALQMYSTGGQEESASSILHPQFLQDLSEYHGDRLIRLAVFRLHVTRAMLQQIPSAFPNLEQLYTSIAQKDLVCFQCNFNNAVSLAFRFDRKISVAWFPARRDYAQYTSTSPSIRFQTSVSLLSWTEKLSLT